MNEFFWKKMKEYSDLTDNFLDEYLSNLHDVPVLLSESMTYSIVAGGKRLRPALLLGACSIFSDEAVNEAVPFAAALEMIHTYSLIHDDLPSMDDDDVRRGKPSNHILFGEAEAILAGDALLNSAIENILGNLVQPGLDRKIKAAVIIMKAAGPAGMIGGQIMDIRGTDNAESLRKMHLMKTGALIKAAILAGAVIGGCSLEDEKYLESYAENLGCAFQIKDDILDVESSTAVLGKPGGSDIRNDKITYVSLYGLNKAGHMLREHTQKAVEFLSKINSSTKFLSELALFAEERKN